jgi:hypothetical protein
VTAPTTVTAATAASTTVTAPTAAPTTVTAPTAAAAVTTHISPNIRAAAIQHLYNRNPNLLARLHVRAWPRDAPGPPSTANDHH